MGRWTSDEHGCIYDEAGCFARLRPNKADRLATRHNADIDARDILISVVQSLQHSGQTWTIVAHSDEVRRFIARDVDRFNEKDLHEFAQAIQKREDEGRSYLRDTKATDESINLAKHGKRGGGGGGGGAAGGRKGKKQPCKYHPQHPDGVWHTEDECRKNPKNMKNKGKDDYEANDELDGEDDEGEGDQRYANVVCYNCKKRGHLKSECPDLKHQSHLGIDSESGNFDFRPAPLSTDDLQQPKTSLPDGTADFFLEHTIDPFSNVALQVASLCIRRGVPNPLCHSYQARHGWTASPLQLQWHRHLVSSLKTGPKPKIPQNRAKTQFWPNFWAQNRPVLWNSLARF